MPERQYHLGTHREITILASPTTHAVPRGMPNIFPANFCVLLFVAYFRLLTYELKVVSSV